MAARVAPAGSVITPFYDSMLVKVIASGQTYEMAMDRMHRALTEFRIRGVKTNIPFLENVVNHPVFHAGSVTTSFLDETPGLFRFTPRKDRATKLLTYLGNPYLHYIRQIKEAFDGKDAERVLRAILVQNARHAGAHRFRWFRPRP